MFGEEILIIILLGVRISSVYLVCISVTFEPTGDRFALLLVGMACTFDMVSHVQQSVRRVAKHMMKEFQEVLNTSPNASIWSFFEMVILCFANCCSPILVLSCKVFLNKVTKKPCVCIQTLLADIKMFLHGRVF